MLRSYTKWLSLATTILLCIDRVKSVDIEYCSELNTGSDFIEVINNYQSNGACMQTCQSNYAFAILQGKGCWCSNYVPGTTASTGKCSDSCSGYPDDKCGSIKAGLFAYIALDIQPSGTLSISGSSTQVSSSASPRTVTFVQTVTASEHTTSSSFVVDDVTTTSTSSFSTSSTTTAPSTKSTSWAPTPVTTVMTVTGQVQTVTITPTVPPSSSTEAQRTGPQSFSSNTGKVVGLAVGLALLTLIVAAVMILLMVHRRRKRDSEFISGGGDGSESGDINSSPSRSRSMSQLGLIGMGGGSLNEKQLPRITTTIPRHGQSNSLSALEIKRLSSPRVVDQRLDPNSLWAPPIHDNSSSTSMRSLQDDRDYSRRVLKLTNPDD